MIDPHLAAIWLVWVAVGVSSDPNKDQRWKKNNASHHQAFRSQGTF